MIMPSKYLKEEDALIGVGAKLLQCINFPITLASLWDKIKEGKEDLTFERFTLALDLLYSIGLIVSEGNKIKRVAL